MARTLGQVRYPYLDFPGGQITLEIRVFSTGYRCLVMINGVPARAAQRRTLAGALRWGLDTAEWQAALLGIAAPPLPFDRVWSDISAQLAA
ncbi:MAG: hypothetical protein RMM58_09710 [Chloroflexota bacterium]|nr:hypothetical protein [Dehalococcoidia bacterium]MDW8254144.1 hypothetical protein [Chloroflexota bacterium]